MQTSKPKKISYTPDIEVIYNKDHSFFYKFNNLKCVPEFLEKELGIKDNE